MQKKMLWLIATPLIITGFCFAQTESKDTGQNPGFPRVVASLNLHNRTLAIGPTTLYTPVRSGVFRISGTMTCTTNGIPGSGWETGVLWQNEVGSNSGVVVSEQCQNLSFIVSQTPVTLNATKGTPISIFTGPTGGGSRGTQYNAYIILEQLE